MFVLLCLLAIGGIAWRNNDEIKLKGTPFILRTSADTYETCIVAYKYGTGNSVGVTSAKVTDVYWNSQYILATCNQKDSTRYYIIKILAANTKPVPWKTHGPMSLENYRHYKDSLCLEETKMSYENYYKPWWKKIRHRKTSQISQ